ncbi:MAG: GNAT family N-acetyltransferase [Actinomycetota bacterium]|nr:GNAT family N-acetyltransferase [Actinomycetota bacterium]
MTTDTSEKDVASRVAQGVPGAWRAIVGLVEGGSIDRVDGLVITLTNIPDPQLNASFVERPPDDPAAALNLAASIFAAHGHRLSIDLPRGRHPDVERTVADLGLEIAVSRPGMAAEIASVAPAAPPDGVELLRVSGLRELRQFWEIQSAVFDMAPEVIRVYVPQATIFADGVTLFLARLNGKPVACCAAYEVEGSVGIFGVATLPDVRRRGIGTAVTAAAVDDARARADLAWLQATEEGLPVYRGMGFSEVSDWDVWVLP